MSHMYRLFTIDNRKVNSWSSEGHRTCLAEILSPPPHSVIPPHSTEYMFQLLLTLTQHETTSLLKYTYTHILTLIYTAVL
jgi:hypothetical protein